MGWNENLTNLNYVLAGLYPLTQDSYRIVAESDLSPMYISFSQRGIDTWYSILSEAVKRNKVEDVIKVVYKQYPDNPYLKSAMAGELNFATGPIIGKDIAWNSSYSTSSLEKLMGSQSTLLPIRFLERGLKCARSVVRIRTNDGSLGSGFLIKNNLIITNRHVIHDRGEAQNAVVQFNYEETETGALADPKEYPLDPDHVFLSSGEDDWTCVRIQGDANTEWGQIAIEPVDIQKTQRVNIIQHPGGQPKQIALYRNLVTYADDSRIQYLTDTLPGSSGSPVFNSQWQLVAVHHSGGHIREPDTQDIVYRNEGIAINCILQELKKVQLL